MSLGASGLAPHLQIAISHRQLFHKDLVDDALTNAAEATLKQAIADKDRDYHHMAIINHDSPLGVTISSHGCDTQTRDGDRTMLNAPSPNK